MTRLSRLTNIFFHLQSRRVTTAQELADKFGISQRTVYRDIRALEEAGVPVIGEVGTGYYLMEDYRIPPVMFSEQEINALMTAQQIIKMNRDKSLEKGIDDLVTKVKALLKYSSREKSEKLEERIFVFSNTPDQKTEYLASIQSAIVNTQILKIKYHTFYSDSMSERRVEPIAVYLTKNNWLLIAFCQLRKGIREFRIDRILSLEDTSETFAERHFSFGDYLGEHYEKNS
ncbi:YafY family protein [uncultured Imperialibacter sp.]|uniref:helix-turn-helix transcriptional regulator n=1 Tax=uncultured Imperialibacter sp. TaxID=1672639 RepID=UPI0030DB2AF6|tara:strand:- start:42 stop:731 length:690 start_codon:yes stop_codon:yes gene_type:complete